MSIIVQTELPDILWYKAQLFIQNGWASNTQQLMTEAPRRHLESHQNSLTERFILDDVQWGLHGND